MNSVWPVLAILILFQAAPVAATPQQQHDDSTSIADAARRSRELKKEQPKSAKVWDNDTIPRKPGDVSVIGQAPAVAASDDASGKSSDDNAKTADKTAAPASTPAAPAAEKAEASETAQKIAAIQADIAAAKSHLQSVKADLDILQRTFVLDSQMYYSKPNYVADKDGAAKIDGEKAEVDAKQQEVADAQMKVDQLEAKLAAVR